MNESLTEQMEVFRGLSERVHAVFIGLRTTEMDYLLSLEEYRNARLALDAAIDEAYIRNEVVGKNEREREASLRQLLPAEHEVLHQADGKVRHAERAYRTNLRDSERLALQVKIAAMAIGVQLDGVDVIVDVNQPQFDPGPRTGIWRPAEGLLHTPKS